MLDVLIADPVLARALRDLLGDKVTLSCDGMSRRACHCGTGQRLATIDWLDSNAGVEVNGDCQPSQSRTKAPAVLCVPGLQPLKSRALWPEYP